MEGGIGAVKAEARLMGLVERERAGLGLVNAVVPLPLNQNKTKALVVFDYRIHDRDELAHVGDFVCVRHIVGFDSRVRMLEFPD